MNIKEQVKKLTKKLGTNDPYEISNIFNINISYAPLGNINGYYVQLKRNKFIVINSDLDELHRKFVCAHEIGHALLHSQLNTLFLQKNTLNIKGKFETQANEFAAELLVDDELLKEYEGYSLNNISTCTGIDIKYLELKFKK